MAIKVIDTSALAALVFVEPEGQRVAEMIQDDQLIAPTLLSFELANVCLTKIRRHPHQKPLLLAGFQSMTRLPLMLKEVNFSQVVELAQDLGLTVYDSAFLWLAIFFDIDLVTLDQALTKALKKMKK